MRRRRSPPRRRRRRWLASVTTGGRRFLTVASMEATVEVSGLRKRFGPTVALDGMTFTVQPRQVTGIVGPNGVLRELRDHPRDGARSLPRPMWRRRLTAQGAARWSASGPGLPLGWLLAPAVAPVGIAFAYGPANRPGVGAVVELRGPRPNGAAHPGDRGVRAERRARAAGELGVGRGRGTDVRLAAPDARCRRAGGSGGRQVGLRRRRRGSGRLGNHGARQRDRQRRSHASVTNAHAYLPYLAVAACCTAVVIYAVRPERGLQ